MRDFLRTRALAEMVEADGLPMATSHGAKGRATANGAGRGSVDRDPQPVADPADELAANGWSDIQGFVLTRQAHDEIAAVDLATETRSFGGSALIVGVSRSARMGAGAARFSEHLRSLGASCHVESVTDGEAPNFGRYHYGSDDDPDTKRDLQADLERSLTSTTVDWIRSVEAAGA
jgi:hypothetical protein